MVVAETVVSAFCVKNTALTEARMVAMAVAGVDIVGNKLVCLRGPVGLKISSDPASGWAGP